MRIDRHTVVVLVVAVALGWWLGHSPASPVGPPAKPDRPVLHAFGRIARTAARLGLWMAVAGEKAPERTTRDERQMVRAPAVGIDGLPELDHAEGW